MKDLPGFSTAKYVLCLMHHLIKLQVTAFKLVGNFTSTPKLSRSSKDLSAAVRRPVPAKKVQCNKILSTDAPCQDVSHCFEWSLTAKLERPVVAVTCGSACCGVSGIRVRFPDGSHDGTFHQALHPCILASWFQVECPTDAFAFIGLKALADQSFRHIGTAPSLAFLSFPLLFRGILTWMCSWR